MLLRDQRALLVTHRNDHPIVVCPSCSEVLRFEQIVADVIMAKRDFCPVCRTDLTVALLQHLAECTVKRVQEREIRERSGDSTSAALRESERLRETGQAAIDNVQRIGADYIPIGDRWLPAPSD